MLEIDFKPYLIRNYIYKVKFFLLFRTPTLDFFTTHVVF